MISKVEFSVPLLKALTVDCKDNGSLFTVTHRLDAILEEMTRSGISFMKAGQICRLFAKTTPRYGQHIVLVSSHVDCVFKRLFCREDETCFEGTFDNSITNAALVTAMNRATTLPGVIAVFTGDEERNGRGAAEAVHLLKELGCIIDYAICLDVTNEGWDNNCSFTVENILTGGRDSSYFSSDQAMLARLNGVAASTDIPFCTVPEGDADEAWDYDEMGISSFSLCMPCFGDMHSEEGVIIKKKAYGEYSSLLGYFLSRKL